MNTGVLRAIFQRNFTSYFLNPTGYVFICVFVLLSSLAAFWPSEFFTANLANLDQLNKYFPLIMLIFVPAITMSMWAEERRQGTDELLLTIPATDFDVVMGKYLAAVAIYTVALLFSAGCNFLVLSQLGSPDFGLLAATYIGYWFCGLAMLAIGMVASFLTSNITVGFVLGALFNAIPVSLEYADVVLNPNVAARVKAYGIAEQLRDFTQGIVSLSGTAYFLLIVAVMLYIAMVLIGRRHWLGGRDGVSMAPHFFARTIALGAAAVGVVLLATQYPARADLTSEGLSTLSPSTVKLVNELDQKRPVHIEAFISPVVPDEYVPVRLDLINRLREIKARGGANVTLRINETEPFSEESDRAEKLYGITGQQRQFRVRGQYSLETIFMGVAMTAGLDKVVIPFVETHTPIEYELTRSIATLNGNTKKRIGLFIADRTMFQEVNEQGQPGEPMILAELRKQYDIVDVDTEKPVPDNFDALMVIQPSILRPNQVDQLLGAVRRGTPTVIFQDPLTIDFQRILQQEEQMSQGMPFTQEGEVGKLWNLLGVEFDTREIIAHEYNPISHVQRFPAGFVFVGSGALGKNAAGASLFDEKDPISSGMKDLVFFYPGAVNKKADVKLTFTPLVRTSKASGRLNRSDVLQADMFGMRLNNDAMAQPTGEEYILAARIQGKAPEEPDPKTKFLQAQTPDGKEPATAAEAPKNEAAPAAATSASSATGTAANPYALPTAAASATAAPSASPTATASATGTKPAAEAKPREMNVVIITDLDIMGSRLFSLRNMRQAGVDRPRNFDDITFVLNTLDSLAGDERFIDVRKRRPEHRTLTTLEEINANASAQIQQQIEKYKKQNDDEYTKASDQFNDELEKLRNNTTLKLIDKQSRLAIFEKDMSRRLQAKRQQLDIKFEKEQKEEMRKLSDEIRGRQSFYKQIAVFIPPIFPLIIGLVVFFSRRAGEQEGVDRARLR